MAEINLRKNAVSGALWTATEKIMTQVVSFVFGIILARLLDPSDYGVVGMLGIFFAIAGTFMDSGMGSALIRKNDRTDADLSTVFFFNLATAAFFYTLFYITAPWIADFYHMPILKTVMRVVAISLIIGAVTGVQRTVLTINLQFRKQSIISIIGLLVSGVTGITLAYMGYGVWALVFQGIASSVITSAIIWATTSWHPKFIFSKKSFNDLFGFGSKILCSSLINTIYNNLTTLVVGRVYSPADVGYYNRGNGYANLPTQTVQDMALKVNYPILAKLGDDDEALIRAYKKLLSVPMYILYPMLIGLAVLGEPLITIMIGEKWLPCVRIMQVLCVGYMFSPLTHLNLNLLYVKARTDLVLKLELIKKPIAFLLLFASIPFGIIWMVIGKAFYEFIAFSFNCYYTGKILDYGELKQLKVLAPIFLNAFIMGGVVMLVMMPFTNPWVKIAVGFPTGVISYILFSIIIKDQNYEEVKNIIKEKVFAKLKKH